MLKEKIKEIRIFIPIDLKGYMRKTREPFIEKYKEKEAARYIT
jgi:hypothetical protein